MTIKFDRFKKSKVVTDLEHINKTLMICILELMPVDKYPKMKETQLMLKSVKRFYEKALKDERIKNNG